MLPQPISATVAAATFQNRSRSQKCTASSSNRPCDAYCTLTLAAAYTATTVPQTARTNRTINQSVCRLARSCASKKSIGSGERDFHCLTLDGVLDLPRTCLGESAPAGDERDREDLPSGVVGHPRVVVGLPRERHLVLGRS